MLRITDTCLNGRYANSEFAGGIEMALNREKCKAFESWPRKAETAALFLTRQLFQKIAFLKQFALEPITHS